MDWLIVWDHLIFVIPILVGTILAAGSMFGLHGDAGHGGGGHDVHVGHGHAGHAGHHGHGHTHGTGHRSLLSRAGSYFGFSKAPLTTMLMVMAYMFGLPGLAMDLLLEPLPGHSLLALFTACFCFATLTPIISRVLARYLPQDETEAQGAATLLGELARADFDTSGTEVCHALVRSGGTLFQVQIRIQEPTRKGDAILLTEYDTLTKQYSGTLAKTTS